MRKLWIGIPMMAVIAAALVCGAMSRAEAEGEDLAKDLLFVCQDEKTIEIAIADYLERAEGVKARREVAKNDDQDMFLRYTLSPDGVPEVTVTVDTLVSGKKDKRITERVIRIVMFYILPEKAKTPEARRKILELNNDWLIRKWMPGRIYIDKDGDIALESFINIPGVKIPVHAEMVNDMLARTLNSWKQYYVELAKTVPVK